MDAGISGAPATMLAFTDRLVFADPDGRTSGSEWTR